MDLKEVAAGNPKEHWYYRHKSKVVINAITRHVQLFSPLIDVGSGSGFFAEEVRRNFGSEVVICVDPNYEKSQTGFRNGILYQNVPPTKAGNLYLFIDVLEHVKDPRELIAEYLINSNPGAIFIFTVPAFMSLWSPHDVYLRHFKRYTLRELEALAIDSKLEIMEAKYLFAAIFPLVYLYRKIFKHRRPSSDLKKASPFTNSIFGALLKLDSILSINRSFGTSAFVVGKSTEVKISAQSLPEENCTSVINSETN